MTEVNRRWLLRERPKGLVGPEHFELVEAPVPAPGAEEILIRTLYFSSDPTQRGWLHEEGGYIEPVAIGSPMRAGAIGQVVSSNDPNFAPGDIVTGTMAWETHHVTKSDTHLPLRKIDPSMPLTWTFSLFGITGLTAYFGVTEVGKVKEGDIVLISGAAGATGLAAAQIARIKGAAKVIGIAGGSEKCAYLTEKGGYDAAIDYKQGGVSAKVKELAPDGVDFYYDNVGGDLLEAALDNLAMNARIAICGGISHGYDSWAVENGPRNYMLLILKNATMQGFLVLNYMERFPEAIAAMAEWVKAGHMQPHETVLEGFEELPGSLQGLFTGRNIGKMITHVADPA